MPTFEVSLEITVSVEAENEDAAFSIAGVEALPDQEIIWQEIVDVTEAEEGED